MATAPRADRDRGASSARDRGCGGPPESGRGARGDAGRDERARGARALGPVRPAAPRVTAFQYLSADLQMPTPRIDSLAPGVSDPADEPILPAGFYMGLGDSQSQADAATAQAQHDAALAAIA